MSSDAATHRAAPWRSPLAIVGVAALILVWCALWGSFSFANVASGSVVAVVAAWPVLGQASLAERVRPVALLRLVGPVLADLATSTVHVAWEALTPTDHTQESVIEVPSPAKHGLTSSSW
ncbi:MAG: Na+/H+ antiporter subunit E [Acidimicrobiales bacterium]